MPPGIDTQMPLFVSASRVEPVPEHHAFSRVEAQVSWRFRKGLVRPGAVSQWEEKRDEQGSKDDAAFIIAENDLHCGGGSHTLLGVDISVDVANTFSFGFRK